MSAEFEEKDKFGKEFSEKYGEDLKAKGLEFDAEKSVQDYNEAYKKYLEDKKSQK